MSKRVVFLCYHGIGHINPCFALGRLLEREGHVVTIASVAHFNGYVTRAGFSHYPLKSVPFGLGFESWMNTQRKVRFHYWANLRDRYKDQLYFDRERELKGLVNDLNPDVIFIDATQATDFIVLYELMKKRRIAHAMLHAMFPTHALPGRPPINTMVVPGDAKEEQAALARMSRKRNLIDLKERLTYLGMSDRKIINRRLQRNQIPPHHQLRIPSLFDYQVSGVPSLILAPRQFDYPQFDSPEDYHYVGFMQHETPTPEGEWLQTKTKVLELRATGSRLVYCSFGTVDAKDEKLIDKFLIRLADAVTARGDLLVVSLGRNKIAPPGLARDNVWLFATVPQTDVLRCCDVFVTHGGLSSIKEAIDAIVPMLMIVVHTQFDPPGNAARVQFHGFGEVGNVRSDTPQIGRQLNALLTDERYRANIKALQATNSAIVPNQFLAIFNVLSKQSDT